MILTQLASLNTGIGKAVGATRYSTLVIVS